MKSKMKFAIVALCALAVVFISGAVRAAATEYNWTGPTEANTPATAYDWTSPGYWDTTPYPQDADSIATFKTDASIYVKVPDSLTLQRIKSGAKKTIVLAENLTCGSFSYSTYVNPAVRIYAQTLSDFTGGGYAEVCADVAPKDGSMAFNSDPQRFRFDLYANSSDPCRTNMISNWKSCSVATGNFRFTAPRSADVQASTWAQTKESPYLKRVSATDHVLAVGTAVTGVGIPNGTFLRRNFENGWIELSNPVSETLGENELTFGSFESDAYQHLEALSPANNFSSYISLRKADARGKATLEIDTLTASYVGFDSEDGSSYPWRLILHETKGSGRVVFRYRNDVEFAVRSDGGALGFPQHAVQLLDSGTSVDFTVGSGLEASILALSNVVGKVTKKGGGMLSASLGENADASTGSIVVEEGVFEVLGTTTGAAPRLQSVTVRAGATLKLSENATIMKFSADPGAIVDGPGSVEVPGAGLADLPQGVRFTGGASFVIRTKDGGVLKSRPSNVTKADLGNPAFWVNTDDPENDMTYEVVGSVTNVTRWNDCRAKDNPQGDYRFALTNYLPAVLKTPSTLLARPCVEMAKADSVSSVTTAHGLVWDKTVTGIRAVFVVWNSGANCHQGFYGGYLLGWFGSGWGDFARNGNSLFDSTAEPASSRASANVLNGDVFVNGRSASGSYSIANGHDTAGTQQMGSLIESYPIGTGAQANAFAYGGKSAYRTGGQRLYECLVYTNELTYAERMRVREYLSAKWFGTGANAEFTSEHNKLPEVKAADVGAIAVAEGVVDVVKLTAGTDTFAKKGAGELVIEDCVAPDATVSVEGGTLYLKSSALTLDALPYPENVHLHVDASATNTITFKTIDGKGECVKEWASVRGTASVSATAKTANAPLHKIVTATNAGKLKPGMPMVDMGEFYHETASGTYGKKVKDGTAEYMTFTKSTELRTVFLVMGSTHGGGQPIGADMGGQSYNAGGWLRDTSWNLGDYHTKLYQASQLPYCFGKPVTHSSIRLNGEQVDSPTTTGLSGDYDLLVGTTFAEAIKSDAFACAHYQNNIGGLELGEAILSTKWHSPEETRHVEAYLMKKWFGQESEGFREPQIGTLKVAAGATVETLGDGQVTVGSVEGAGTVWAKLAFAGGTADLKVTVADGAISPLVFGATTEFAGGMVTVDGNASTLASGRDYVLVNAPGITEGQSWSLAVSHPRKNGQYKLIVENGRLILRVSKPGLLLIFR